MNQLNEKISIIIPIYNTEKYLPLCLNSCINQTLRDIEIICVNDGSTDNSEQIIKQYQNSDSRIKLIHKFNNGVSTARNTGIKAANGSMLLFLDSDDYLEKNACERIWIEEKETSSDIIVFGTNCFPKYPIPDSWLFNSLEIRTCFFEKFNSSVLFNTSGSMPFVWQKAFSRSFLNNKNLFFEEKITYGEDLVFLMQAFPNAKTFSYIEDILYNYRWIRKGSWMFEAKKHKRKKIETHIKNLDYICSYWLNKNWLKSYGKELAKWMVEFIIIDILDTDIENADTYFQQFEKIINQYNLTKYFNQLDVYHRNYYKQYLKILNE